MMNSKIEKTLLVFVWYIWLITFRFVLPISEPIGNIDKYVVVLLSILATVIVYRVYIYYRNEYVLKKINLLLETNQLDESIKYINKCLSRQKKCCTIYAYKLYVLAMCGKIIEFEKMLSECEKSNKYKKLIKLGFVQGLISIINYFKTGTNSVVSVNQQYWVEIMNVLSLLDEEKNIPVLLSWYNNTKFAIIKSFIALKIHLTYLKTEKTEKAEYYLKKALEYAPSLEIAYYIEERGNSGGHFSTEII